MCIYTEMIICLQIILILKPLEAFMKALEKDAQERSDRRKAAKAEATVYKDEGNAAFKSGDYEKAVDLYSQVCLLYLLITYILITWLSMM